jgi:hypothetical protein
MKEVVTALLRIIQTSFSKPLHFDCMRYGYYGGQRFPEYIENVLVLPLCHTVSSLCFAPSESSLLQLRSLSLSYLVIPFSLLGLFHSLALARFEAEGTYWYVSPSWSGHDHVHLPHFQLAWPRFPYSQYTFLDHCAPFQPPCTASD